MKPVTEEHGETIASKTLTPVPMGISDDPEDRLMILNVLSNSLYTDKVAAVLREYGCNAFDANVEAGAGDTPIEVRLPNKLEPTVAIRDIGPGMTEDQILSVFCKLGRSTKRGSNAFTGMLGIGSKAGFAYGDSFMVTSFTKGERIVYNAFRDKGVPRLALMHREKSDEPDGIEVKVPVRVTDINEFITKAERVFRYFKVRPNIKGAKVEFDVSPPQITGKTWRYTGDARSVAIMGNVGYDLKSSSMGTIDVKYTTLLDLGVELDFEIGDLEIAANREGLQYKDHTKAAICKRLDEVAREIGKSFSDQIAKANTLWDAKVLYGDNFEKMGSGQYGMRTLKEVVQGAVTWNGKTINSARYDLRSNPIPGITIWQITKPWRGATRLRRYLSPWELYASSKATLAINDLESGKSSPGRERGFFYANPEADSLTIFTFPGKKAQDQFIKSKGLEGAPFVQLSTIPVLKTASTGSSGPSSHRSKHSAKVFILNETAGIIGSANSLWWNTTEVDLRKDGGVYVEIDTFRVREPGGNLDYPSNVVTKVMGMRGAGLLKGPLYGFKKSRLDKLGKKWVKLEDYLQMTLEKLVKDKGLAQDMADYNAAAAYKHIFDAKWHKLMPAGSAARAWLEEQHRMLHPKSSLALIAFVQSKNGEPWLTCPDMPSPLTDLLAEEKKIRGLYPMLDLWDSAMSQHARSRCRGASEAEMKTFAGYVKLVENK